MNVYVILYRGFEIRFAGKSDRFSSVISEALLKVFGCSGFICRGKARICMTGMERIKRVYGKKC